MSEALYEQYKEALRQGHMAALRGRLDVAAAAYRDAARFAPDRALPYVGLGGVLTRLGRSDEALAAYSAALDRAPADEGAMRGRADVLAARRSAFRGGRYPRPAVREPRARRAPGRRVRRRTPVARAGRIPWSPPAGRGPRGAASRRHRRRIGCRGTRTRPGCPRDRARCFAARGRPRDRRRDRASRTAEAIPSSPWPRSRPTQRS